MIAKSAYLSLSVYCAQAQCFMSLPGFVYRWSYRDLVAKQSAELQYEATGLTQVQLNQKMLALHQQGLSLRDIGRHLGISHMTVKYRLDELVRGKKRVSVRRECCEGCFDLFPTPQLDRDGLCAACRS